MGKPGQSEKPSQPAQRVLKPKDVEKARRRAAKIEKKLGKLAAMTEEEQLDMCERQVQRKLEKGARRASRDGSENPYADIMDERTSKKDRKKRLAQLKASIYEKVVAKRSKREEKLARLRGDIAMADNAMQVDAKSLSAASSKKSAAVATTEDSSARPSGWNNWAAAEFESDERKSKFLRFMGIKSSGTEQSGDGASPFASAITKEGANKIHKDLERQFQAGLQKRQQAQCGGRGGLGM
ncbi:hypothetical protein H4R26_005991 [Coemansia thaxteri]|uniref:Small acidic protein n=1 Tax=Coemansia thaxteri TaxID=2663907 RepID=A0A9W8EC14_9FUNG|nr:hypothetical protein H4R26_005991 [Coemansia thaxteri]